MRKFLIVTLSLLLTTASTGANALGPTNTGTGDRIVFDLSQQRVWLVNETKSVVHTYLVSGSKYPEHHNAGTYKVFSKSRKTTSYLGNATMNYMVRFQKGKNSNIGFHDLPLLRDGTYAQSEAQLGQRLSDGCVRQRLSNAKLLYDFAKVGTPVIVIE